MSYDLRLFSCLNPANELEKLAKKGEIKREDDAFALGGDGWQILFNSPDEVESEDIPPAVSDELPGIRFSVEINIEGNYKKAHLAKALALAKTLAKESRGVVVDEQADTIQLPRGMKRVDLGSAKGEVENLEMSWWFEDYATFAASGIERIIKAMETHAPEVLPKRYGLWEPPQFKYAEKGRAHFISFLRKNLGDPIVWYPNRPFTHVWIDAIEQPGGSKMGYKCNRFNVDIDARALDLPGWPVALRRLFIAIAEVLQPFYGEIYRGESPIRSWFFNGVPKKLGLAAVIGPPYDKLWPQFAEQSSAVGRLRVMDSLEEKKPLMISPPKAIAQPEPYRPHNWGMAALLRMGREQKIKYPKTWPFAPPFDGPEWN